MENRTEYERVEGETTQWEDLQRKFGNLPPKEPVQKADPFSPAEEPRQDKAWLEQAEAPEDLEDAEDDFADDRFLEQYRQQRLKHLQQAAGRPQFGAVTRIARDQFIGQVTDASRECWVVLHLFQDTVLGCKVLQHCLEELAGQYRHVKFLSMRATDCIPGYPDMNLPTVLVYHDGQCARTLVGLQPFGGSRLTPESVAAGLNSVGPICADGVEDAGGGSDED